MKKGPKPKSSSEVIAAGTFNVTRHRNMNHEVMDGSLPQMPEDLTEDGMKVWLDNVGRVSAAHGAMEFDSELFATWCDLQGRIRKAFKEGGCPRVQAISESRKMMELLRIAGPSSRVQKVAPAAPGAGVVIDGNPFTVNGRGHA